jgi:hypothetical protein
MINHRFCSKCSTALLVKPYYPFKSSRTVTIRTITSISSTTDSSDSNNNNEIYNTQYEQLMKSLKLQLAPMMEYTD